MKDIPEPNAFFVRSKLDIRDGAQGKSVEANGRGKGEIYKTVFTDGSLPLQLGKRLWQRLSS